MQQQLLAANGTNIAFPRRDTQTQVQWHQNTSTYKIPCIILPNLREMMESGIRLRDNEDCKHGQEHTNARTHTHMLAYI